MSTRLFGGSETSSEVVYEVYCPDGRLNNRGKIRDQGPGPIRFSHRIVGKVRDHVVRGHTRGRTFIPNNEIFQG